MSLFETNETRVVNIKHGSPFDIYIGRGKCPLTGKYPGWGNLWSSIPGTSAEFKTKSTEESCQKYKEYILADPEKIERLKELKGKVLGCWCMPKNPTKGKLYCHGQVLIELIEELT